MKRISFLLIALFTIVLAACNKEKSATNSTEIVGTYTLKFISAKTKSTVTGGRDKAVTVSEYTTINNSGVIVIDATNFKGTGLTYEVKTTATTSYYEDNNFIYSSPTPVSAMVPPTNSSAPYKLIGTDSIFFKNGSFVSEIRSGQNGGNGGKYTLSGKTLIIQQHAIRDTVIRFSGETFREVDDVQATFVMEKN